jgi:hypothetical protein
MKFRILNLGMFGLAWLLVLGQTGHATPIIRPGNIFLTADSRNQTVPLFVEGGDAVQGLNLHLTVEKGGPDLAPDGRLGPRIVRVNTVTNGTIFAGNNDGQTEIATFPQAWVVSTATASDTVPANGILAWVTFDTTGFSLNSGPFTLSLSDPSGVPTDFAGIPAQVTDAQLVMVPVPEATSGLTLALGLCGFWALRGRLFSRTREPDTDRPTCCAVSRSLRRRMRMQRPLLTNSG